MTAVFTLLTALLLFAPAPASGLRPASQPAEDTTILSSSVSGAFALSAVPFLEQFRPPMVVFYQPGTQEMAVSGSVVGIVVSNQQSAEIKVVACPNLNPTPPLQAICLAPGPLPGLGTYSGTAELFAPSGGSPQGGAEESAEAPSGSVAVAITIQRPLPSFALIAVIGILLSLALNWYATEYQTIRKLRSQCAPFCPPENGAKNQTSCPEEGNGQQPKLILTGLCQLFDQQELQKLRSRGFLLWLATFFPGARPDYEALNKSIAQAGSARASFFELCQLTTTLRIDRAEIDAVFEEIGGTGICKLSEDLQEAGYDDDNDDDGDEQETEIPAGDVQELLDGRKELHNLARRWYRLARHVDALCTSYENLTNESCLPPQPVQAGEYVIEPIPQDNNQPNEAPPAQSQQPAPVAQDPLAGNNPTSDAGPEKTAQEKARQHIALARLKLGRSSSTFDLEVLRPENDIQAAWAALEELRQSLVAAGQTTPNALLALEAAPAIEKGFPSIEDLGAFVSSVQAAWRKLEPKLNAGVIFLLLILSFIAAMFLGYTTIYLDKPWGSLIDILVLLLLGGGIHSGLTGIANAVMSQGKSS